MKKTSSKGFSWELIHSEPVFCSKWMTVEKRSYRLPTGDVVEDYYHLGRPNYVLVLAEDGQKRILLEKLYRRGVDDFVYELPAGWINEGEKPIEAAKRELREETGSAGEGETTLEIYPQPGFSSMKAHVAILRVTDQGEHSQNIDEQITFEWVEKTRIDKMIKEGKIKDMGLLSALSVWDATRM